MRSLSLPVSSDQLLCDRIPSARFRIFRRPADRFTLDDLDIPPEFDIFSIGLGGRGNKKMTANRQARVGNERLLFRTSKIQVKA